MSRTHLVVISHFGNYKPGDAITDELEIARVLAGANHGQVVRSTTTNAMLAEEGAQPPQTTA